MKADVTARYLNEVQVSEMTGRALSTLRNERARNEGMPYIKIGRSVRYDLVDVIRFMDAHKIMTQCTLYTVEVDNRSGQDIGGGATYCAFCPGNPNQQEVAGNS